MKETGQVTESFTVTEPCLL